MAHRKVTHGERSRARWRASLSTAIAILWSCGAAAQVPDLEIAITALQVPASYAIEFSVVVTNVAEGPADPANTAIGLINVVGFFDSETQPLIDSEVADFETTLPPTPLAPGESTTVTHEHDYGAPGTHTAWFLVDSVSFSTNPGLSSLALPELGKENNVVSVTVEVVEPSVELPNLEVSFLNASVAGNQVTFAGEVANLGDAAADAFDLTFFRHRDTEPSKVALPDQILPVPGLGIGEVVAFDTVWEPAPNGSYLPWLCADHQKDDVVEHDEGDNCLLGQAYSVLLDGDFPDVVVTDLAWHSEGGSIVYDVTIANQGTGFASEFALDAFFSSDEEPSCAEQPGQAWTTKLIPALAVSSEMTTSLTWEAPPVGTHSAWFRLDCPNVLSETDETNNGAGPIAVNVTEADLAVTKMSAEVVCQDVTLAVAIENLGHFAAPPFEVHFFEDRAINPGLETSGDHIVVVEAGLGPGDDITILFEDWTGAADDTYRPWVVVNAGQKVTESNYANNIDTAGDVVVDSTTCTCEQLGTCSDEEAAPEADVAEPEPDAGTADDAGSEEPSGSSRGSAGGCSAAAGTGSPWALSLLAFLVAGCRRRRGPSAT